MPRPSPQSLVLGLLSLGLSFSVLSDSPQSHAYSYDSTTNPSNRPNPQYIAQRCGLLSRLTGRCRKLHPPRGDYNPNIPYLITPVHTKVRQGQRPIVRWNSVNHDVPYQLQVIELGVSMEPLTLEENDWQYAAELPLEPGTRYRIRIRQQGTDCFDSGLFSDECEGDFTVLNDAEMAAFEADWNRLSSQERNEAIAVARLYQNHELYADAIQHLEQEILTGAAQREDYYFLGELYAEVGLYHTALTQYREAQNFLAAQSNRDMQARLNVSMGLAYWQLGEFNEALAAFEAAQNNAEVFSVREQEELTQKIQAVHDRLD
ncbi:MAG: tetratricopeptide repeat protein [Cyanobacteria bacterium P01_G01_bin.54]